MHTLYDGLRDLVVQRRRTKGPMNSIMDRLLDQQKANDLTTHQVTLLAGVATKGGSDTSASVLASFVQAMVTWPEVQRKAQAEIDAVISEDRVPDFDDYDKLPFIAQIIKEAHRWRPVAPLSVPHALSQGECGVQFVSIETAFAESIATR
jgi:cytochrome P450 family 619